MQPIISSHMWVSLPNEVRGRIRHLFKIPQSSNVVVNDGRVETDGTTNEDLKHLTIEKMQAYLSDTSTDFHKLFDKVIMKVNDELYPKPVSTSTEIKQPMPETVIVTFTSPKKKGRPSKKNA